MSPNPVHFLNWSQNAMREVMKDEGPGQRRMDLNMQSVGKQNKRVKPKSYRSYRSQYGRSHKLPWDLLSFAGLYLTGAASLNLYICEGEHCSRSPEPLILAMTLPCTPCVAPSWSHGESLLLDPMMPGLNGTWNPLILSCPGCAFSDEAYCFPRAHLQHWGLFFIDRK